ncbi:hypothetical protein GCM10023331_24660 [Algivirga pacifica]|uniref:WD40-like Beta Propeller Repeat n=2 Tax=Algivirga pacifica TaxID=1162670 RepID=A0ABP9DFG7_9BACT
MGQEVSRLEVKGYYPKFSPDGKQILLTSSKFTGLQLFDLKDKSLRTLTDKPGAGYKPAFRDGAIVFENKAAQLLESVDLFSGKQTSLTSAFSETVAHYEAIQKIKTRRTSALAVLAAEPTSMLNGVVLTMSDGSQRTIAPLGTKEDYIWTSVSPDGSKVLMKASGYTAVIADMEGNVLQDLGDLEAPRWLGNDQVVYMVTEDNHDSYIKSDVFVMNLKTKKAEQLTKDVNTIALFPDAHEGKVVFNTPEGEVYMISF